MNTKPANISCSSSYLQGIAIVLPAVIGLGFFVYAGYRATVATESLERQSAAKESLRDIGHAVAADIDLVVRPAMQRGQKVASSPETVQALRSGDLDRLQQVCNEAVLGATEIDALALFGADGRILAINDVYGDGTQIPSSRIAQVMERDYSSRPIISNCVKNKSTSEQLEFQVGCDITPAFFNSASGLSVAHSLPVFDEVGQQLGVVSTRLNFERVSKLLDRQRVAAGKGQIQFVSDSGNYFDDKVNAGLKEPVVPQASLAALVAPLSQGDVNEVTLEQDELFHVIFREHRLRTIDQGGIQVMLTAPAAWLKHESHMARAIAVGTPASMGMLLMMLSSLIWFANYRLRKRREWESAAIEMQTIIDAIPAYVYYKDNKNTILKLNKTAAESIGLPVGEIEGRFTEEFFPAEDSKEYLRDDQEVIASAQAKLGIVEEYKPNEHETRYIRTDKIPVMGPSGEYDRLVAIATDITEMKLASAEVDRLAKRLAIANEGAGVGIWDYALGTDEMVWDRTMFGLYGLEPSDEALSLEAWKARLHEDDRLDVSSLFKAAIAGYGKFDISFRVVTPDGGTRYLRAVASLMSDDQGQAERVLGVSWDVTSTEQAYMALTDAQSLLEQTGQIAQIGGWALDLELMEPIWSAEVYRIHEVEYGKKPSLDEAIHFYAPEARDTVREVVQRAISHGECFDIEVPFITAKGRHRWVRSIGTPEMEGGLCKKLWGAFQDITSQREAQNRVQTLARRLEIAADSGGVGVWEYLPESNRLHWDKTTHLIYGTDANSEATIDDWIRLIHPDERLRTEELLHQAINHGSKFESLIRISRPDGEIRYVQVSATWDQDDASGNNRLVGVHSDVTKLRTVEERLSLAMKTSCIGLWDWDIPSSRTYFSDTYFEMLGYEPGVWEPHLDSFKKLIHPDDLQPTLTQVEKQFEDQHHNFECEFRMLTKDGTWRWIRSSGEVVERDHDGNPRRMLGVHIDIHDTKRFDQALRRVVELKASETEQETLTQLAKAVAEVLEVDFAGVARLSDDLPGHAHLLGGWQGGQGVVPFVYDLAGTPCENVAQHSYSSIASSVRKKFPNDQILQDMQAEGYAGIRLHDGQGRPIGLMMILHRSSLEGRNDIKSTLQVLGARAAAELERFRIETNLRHAKDAAEAANISKSEFLANMSHEIRTPMTAILGYADLLESKPTDEEEASPASDAIRTIRSNADHLLTIINDILDMSKIEAGKMSVERIQMSPAVLADEMITLLRPRALEKELSLAVSYVTEVPEFIESDPTRLRQILLNLTGNAIKFTERGSVTIRVACDIEQERMRFEVVDTGIGMTPEQLRAISQFEAFSQADTSMTRNYGGTGLGLRISNALATMLGGGVEITSEHGMGSTFSVEVDTGSLHQVKLIQPSVSTEQLEKSAEPKQVEKPSELSGLDGLRILLAEDGPDNQRLFSFLLKKAGADVTLAENGRIAVEKIESRSDDDMFDLVLMDMQMPELDGYGATRMLRDMGYSIPIVALTAHAMDGDREKCLEFGCTDYLTKPINKRKMIETCARLGRQASLPKTSDSV